MERLIHNVRRATEAQRQALYDRYGGRCAYCGEPLGKVWHVDHREPVWRGWSDEELAKFQRARGSDGPENWEPACGRCNHWKSALSLREFRNEIAASRTRALKESASARLAVSFGLLKITSATPRFYFERIADAKKAAASRPVSEVSR